MVSVLLLLLQIRNNNKIFFKVNINMYNSIKNFFFIILETFSNFFHKIFFFKKINFYIVLIFLLLTILFFLITKINVIKSSTQQSSFVLLDQFYISSTQKIIIVNIKEVKLVLGVTPKNITFLYTLPSVIKKKI